MCLKYTAEHKSSPNWASVSQHFWRQLGPKGGSQHDTKEDHSPGFTSCLCSLAWSCWFCCFPPGRAPHWREAGEGHQQLPVRQAGACMAPHRECTTQAEEVCGQPGPTVGGSWVGGFWHCWLSASDASASKQSLQQGWVSLLLVLVQPPQSLYSWGETCQETTRCRPVSHTSGSFSVQPSANAVLLQQRGV